MFRKVNFCIAIAIIAASAQAQVLDGEQGSALTRLQAAKIDKETLSSNMESVGKLLEISSAALQIEASQVPEALTKREKARELYKSAKTALAAGDLSKASTLLNNTRMMFFDAVRHAEPNDITAKNLENNYKARLTSVNALLDAYKRIAVEKGTASGEINKIVAQIEKYKVDAANFAQSNKYMEGRSELDRAYLVAKLGISGLRSGDTLVRSLKFASKEEEYHYEIDRNNTHLMLIQVLLAEKRADSKTQDYIAKAKALQVQAEAAASGKDYATGVKLLEQSTSELVRAIRGAGIYIPGD